MGVEVTGQGKTMRVQADAINIISCKSETEPNQWTASLSVEVRGPCGGAYYYHLATHGTTAQRRWLALPLSRQGLYYCVRVSGVV
jgi:hypothetical protein